MAEELKVRGGARLDISSLHAPSGPPAAFLALAFAARAPATAAAMPPRPPLQLTRRRR